jgi:dienelactone hydrolase
VWQATRVWLPPPFAVRGARVSEVERVLEAVPKETTLPSVLYLHGCRGLEEDAAEWGRVLSAAGYAVFAPDAAARGERPPVCPTATLYARSDIPRLTGREAEAGYTLRQMRTFSWLAGASVFLLGFDQGGVVAANWPGREFAGFIITGWSCTSPDVRSGLATRPERPVLAIRWADDPFFRDLAWNGDCQVHLPPRLASRSIVLEGSGHATSPSAEARRAVLSFLNAHAVR